MKPRDIMNRLNDEIDSLAPKTPSERITSTPIKVAKDRESASQPKVARTPFLKTRAFRIMCACLVCVAVLSGVLVPVLMMNGGGGDTPTPAPGTIYAGSTYVSMNINPAVDYVVDNKDRVVNVISRNNDGDILLSNGFKETLIGKDIDDVLSLVIDQATRLGYIDASVRPTAGGKVNAVKISVASDDDNKATEVLNSVTTKVSSHLKDKGILMAVGGQKVDKSLILRNTGITSIENWNEIWSEKESYHFASSVIGKTEEEIADSYKNDFLSKYVEEMFDEMLEDIEDLLAIVGDIKELEVELKATEEELGREEGHIIVINHDYWEYIRDIANGKDVHEEIVSIIDEITDKIAEYNEMLDEFADDEDVQIDLSKVFDKIVSKDDLVSAKVIYKGYYEEALFSQMTGKEKLEGLIAKVSKDVSKLDELFDSLTIVFKGFKNIADNLLNGIKVQLDKVAMTIDEYSNICKNKIDESYNNLINKHSGNVGNVSADEYDKLLEDMMDGMDFDDFWESHHKN